MTDVIYPHIKGGAEKRYHDLAKSLKNIDHEVHIIGMTWWNGHSDYILDGIHYHGVCKFSSLYNKDGRRSIRTVLNYSFGLLFHFLHNDYDIVDSNEFPYIPNFIVKLYCLLKKRPMIVTWHEVWDDHWHDYLGYLMGNVGRFIERKTAKLSNMIVAVSEKTRDDLVEKLGIDPEKIRVVEPIIASDCSDIAPASREFDVLFCGRLIKQKNVDLLIRALPMTDIDMNCGIIGEGPEKKRLMSMVDEYGLNEHVTFLGSLKNHTDVLSYMKSSRLFVFPSKREGYGIAVLEANACGLPVIVVDNKNNASKHLIKNGFNGYVCSENHIAIAEKIEIILRDKELRTKMARNSINMSHTLIRTDATQKLNEIYKELLNKNENDIL